MKTLLLFDIDGTIILNSVAGLTALTMAMESQYKVKLATQDVHASSGKTDFILLSELLESAGIDKAAVYDEQLRAVYIKHLQECVRLDPGIVAPGTIALLNRLTSLPEFTLGLGTGNFRQGAEVKLAYHNLNHFFVTGGFGEDGITRDEVIAKAVHRAEQKGNVGFERVVIIGDTPRDIESAHNNGYYGIAVSTGNFSYQQLVCAKADGVMKDLSDIDEFLKIVRSLPANNKFAQGRIKDEDHIAGF